MSGKLSGRHVPNVQSLLNQVGVGGPPNFYVCYFVLFRFLTTGTYYYILTRKKSSFKLSSIPLFPLPLAKLLSNFPRPDKPSSLALFLEYQTSPGKAHDQTYWLHDSGVNSSHHGAQTASNTIRQSPWPTPRLSLSSRSLSPKLRLSVFPVILHQISESGLHSLSLYLHLYSLLTLSLHPSIMKQLVLAVNTPSRLLNLMTLPSIFIRSI